MTLEDLIADGWQRHADHPRDVADRLAASVGLVEHAAELPSFTRLATHLFAEHLPDPREGIAILVPLRDRFEAAPSGPDRVAATGIATLRHVGGEPGALDRLSRTEHVAALATAASAFVAHQRLDSAVEAYRRALDDAAEGVPDGSPALRALAASGNNLACALEQHANRDAAQDESMIQAADASLTYWQRAGGWLEVERAQYRQARSRLCAGRALDAIACAAQCLQTCEANDAAAFERFFAHAAGALAQRAAGRVADFERSRALAYACWRELGPEERAWCDSELEALGPTDSPSSWAPATSTPPR